MKGETARYKRKRLYARREVCSGTPDVDELLHRELRAEFRPRGLEARHSATAGHCGRRQPGRCGEGFSHRQRRLMRSRKNIEVVSRRVATMISGVTRRPVKVQQLPLPPSFDVHKSVNFISYRLKIILPAMCP